MFGERDEGREDDCEEIGRKGKGVRGEGCLHGALGGTVDVNNEHE